MKKWLILILLLSCSGGEESNSTDIVNTEKPQTEIAAKIFLDSVNEFFVNVIYEVGAEPYTGNIGLSGNDTWDITQTSYEQIFSTHSSRTVTVPRVLGDMTAIADQAKAQWSIQELVDLGEANAIELVNGNVVRLSVIFLNGTFQGSNSTLGVHIGGNPFLFVFKDIVEAAAGANNATRRYVEQATVVHELGHAVGLVNNGLPMVTDHEDNEHPAHTTNEDGVMFWQVAVAGNITSLLSDIILNNELNLFETESLQDGRAYHP